MKTVCPGCGGSTRTPGHKVKPLNDYQGKPLLAIYCPIQDQWYEQATLPGIKPVHFIPQGEQYGLL